MADKNTLLSPLLQLLEQIKPISVPLRLELVNAFDDKEIKKGTILLREGDICTKLWFLANGLLRSYHNIGNKEIISRIMFKDHIVISPGSFFTQTPSTESVEALSDSTVVILTFARLQEIYKKFTEFNYHTRIITEQYFYKQEQRLYMLRKPDATAKYTFFLENYESYSNNIPQKFIASFLNIAPETLSRTRRKLSRIKY